AGRRAVLQVITSTDRRGAEVFGVELGRALEQRGRRVHTVALARGVQEDQLDVPALGPNARAYATLRALRRTARDAGIVVAHGSKTLPACAIATLGLRVPFVYRNIGDPTHWGSTRGRRTRSAFFLMQARAVVALSTDSAAELSDRYHVDRGKIVVIPR